MNKYERLIKAFFSIPELRTGKIDISTLLSYYGDIQVFKKLIKACENNPKKQKEYFAKWNEFIKMRNEEDFIPHGNSNNYSFYKELFNCI